MFHIIWAILFIIKLYKSDANAPKTKSSTTFTFQIIVKIIKIRRS